jgi:hypothetical protein
MNETAHITTRPSSLTEADLRERLRAEKRATTKAAQAFAGACERGDLDEFSLAVDMVDGSVDGWRLALIKASRLSSVSKKIKAAFLDVWIQHKHLPLECGNRRVMANALRVLLPTYRARTAMRLYRGTTALERKRRLYGFSWTSQLEIARDKFADFYRPMGAVVAANHGPAGGHLACA